LEGLPSRGKKIYTFWVYLGRRKIKFKFFSFSSLDRQVPSTNKSKILKPTAIIHTKSAKENDALIILPS